MRKFIHLIYHVIWLFAFRFKTNVITLSFKLELWLNNVGCGNGIKAVNGIPLLYIHSKCTKCRIGNRVTFRSYQDVCWNSKCYLQVKKDATFIIGDNSGLSGTMIFCSDKIEIGNNVMIGGGCRIFDTDFHPIESFKRLDQKLVNSGKSAPVYIADNVFIGTNCIIGKGVRIGQGSVIAAGSVVVKSVPANEIWGGNPARFIRKID